MNVAQIILIVALIYAYGGLTAILRMAIICTLVVGFGKLVMWIFQK